ncbi:hypothetical protein [Paraburkholderia elongata]|uniref:Uncharacterized protein n=1 Tax=Paraburkholderia elongata TaxID=2675747 RepID=A0A972NYC6_9BURK|nr:hypothetical protein [Paraburkholderia elongata]NPT62076.1 hypothetical protein [Paraburkholderia elongata]
MIATIHLDWRNIRCLKDGRHRLKHVDASGSTQHGKAPCPQSGITGQMKVSALTATMFCGSQAAQAAPLCDTESVFCFPCEHIAVFGPPSNGGPF